MRIEALSWEAVTVECDSDPSKARAFGLSQVVLEDNVLTIQELGGEEHQRGVVYVKPVVVLLGLIHTVITAYWASSRTDAGPGDYDLLIPLRVTCHFSLPGVTAGPSGRSHSAAATKRRRGGGAT